MVHQASPRPMGQVLRIHFPIRMPVQDSWCLAGLVSLWGHLPTPGSWGRTSRNAAQLICPELTQCPTVSETGLSCHGQ